jgi:Peptidase family C25
VRRQLLLCVFLLPCAVCFAAALLRGAPPALAPDSVQAARQDTVPQRVFLTAGLSEENLLTFSTTLATRGTGDVLLLDSAMTHPYNLSFLAAAPRREAIEIHNETVDTVRGGFFAKTPKIVVCLAEPRRLLLQAACFAGALEAPLFVHHGTAEDTNALAIAAKTREVYAVGKAYHLCPDLPGIDLHYVGDEQAVFDAYVRRQAGQGRIDTLVVANPEDVAAGLGSMSTLAPWIALQRHAALVLTTAKGDNVESVVKAAVRNKHLAHIDTLILVGNLQALPMEQRPNPIHGKDAFIEMEPMTPTGRDVVSFAVGRLFHEDRGVVTLMLARQGLLKTSAGPPRALVASNPGGSLPLLETFSRNTASELRNAGYQTTPLIGHRTIQEELRRLLPSQTIFLWEGHHSTLVQDYRVYEWPEPLQPSLIFLQSCLALQEPKAQPFLERGAIGVIGTSSRTYSGSGGALSLAFFDALAYEHQSIGAALRSAKNFMLAFAQLKEQRLGAKSQLGGANIRAAWAFSLWGDPTVKLPPATPPEGALASVQHHVRANTITVELPQVTHDKIVSVRYLTEMRANARLAGLLSKQEEEEAHRLVPLVFAEVRLPGAPAGKTPRLHSALPASRWVFCYDARRQTGYLLAMPRAVDNDELRFHVAWEEK